MNHKKNTYFTSLKKHTKHNELILEYDQNCKKMPLANMTTVKTGNTILQIILKTKTAKIRDSKFVNQKNVLI